MTTFATLQIGAHLGSSLADVFHSFNVERSYSSLLSVAGKLNLDQGRRQHATLDILFNSAVNKARAVEDRLAVSFSNLGVSTITGSAAMTISGARAATIANEIAKIELSKRLFS